jgi:hypothetical protein
MAFNKEGLTEASPRPAIWSFAAFPANISAMAAIQGKADIECADRGHKKARHKTGLSISW